MNGGLWIVVSCYVVCGLVVSGLKVRTTGNTMACNRPKGNKLVQSWQRQQKITPRRITTADEAMQTLCKDSAVRTLPAQKMQELGPWRN